MKTYLFITTTTVKPIEDFIISKHGKGKNAKYYKMINKSDGITEISRSTYYRLSKILEKLEI